MIGPVFDSFSAGSRVNLEQEHVVRQNKDDAQERQFTGRRNIIFTMSRTMLLNTTFLAEDKVQTFKLKVILLGRSTTISQSIPLNWVLHLEDR